MSYAATFDTYKVIKNITAQGLPEKQATAIVEAIQGAQQQFHDAREEDLSQLVTKADLKSEIQAIRVEMHDMRVELLKWYIGIAMFQTVTFLAGIIAVAKILHPKPQGRGRGGHFLPPAAKITILLIYNNSYISAAVICL